MIQNEYFIETQNSNIPFIYGPKEYIFANLINDSYDALIIKKDEPSFNEEKKLNVKIHQKKKKKKSKIKMIKKFKTNII